jgi:prepilin peptidase CpaA
MPAPFFPHLAFAWSFLAILLALLGAASYIDSRLMKVPKVLTLTAFGLGVLFNVVRGAWMGGQGQAVWLLGAAGPWAGLADGALFALAGAVAGFALFFIMWMVGACGGGDVKLFAAIGAWVGPMLAVKVLIVTLPVIVAFMAVRFALAILSGDRRAAKRMMSRSRAPATPSKNRPRLLAFSLPVTVATLLVVCWSFRVDLRLLPPTPPAHAQAQGGTNAH